MRSSAYRVSTKPFIQTNTYRIIDPNCASDPSSIYYECNRTEATFYDAISCVNWLKYTQGGDENHYTKRFIIEKNGSADFDLEHDLSIDSIKKGIIVKVGGMELKVKKVTYKAIQLDSNWIPKSQISKFNTENNELTLPEWLIKKVTL
jgi:hypothetical protein